MLGDFLYELSQRDQQVTWLDPTAFTLTASGLNTQVDATYAVPVGLCLILMSLCGNGSAGAGQNNIRITLELSPPSDLGNFVAISEVTSAQIGVATPTLSLPWSGRLYIPQLWTIRCRSSFSASAFANFSELNVLGMLIPIGNIQRT